MVGVEDTAWAHAESCARLMICGKERGSVICGLTVMMPFRKGLLAYNACVIQRFYSKWRPWQGGYAFWALLYLHETSIALAKKRYDSRESKASELEDVDNIRDGDHCPKKNHSITTLPLERAEMEERRLKLLGRGRHGSLDNRQSSYPTMVIVVTFLQPSLHDSTYS
jgi:hypothetical protein